MFAPNMDFHSVNHLNGESSGTRNVLIEAARIARGKILDLEDLESQKFDAVIFLVDMVRPLTYVILPRKAVRVRYYRR